MDVKSADEVKVKRILIDAWHGIFPADQKVVKAEDYDAIREQRDQYKTRAEEAERRLEFMGRSVNLEEEQRLGINSYYRMIYAELIAMRLTAPLPPAKEKRL